MLPKSPIAAAINYVFNQWEALQRYTTNGDLHIDNNVSERTLKLIGIGRLNWLFVGRDNGGQTAAVLFSFTATCKYLGIDSFAYLRDVLGRLPTHPAERLEELLPHRWQVLRGKPECEGDADDLRKADGAKTDGEGRAGWVNSHPESPARMTFHSPRRPLNDVRASTDD